MRNRLHPRRTAAVLVWAFALLSAPLAGQVPKPCDIKKDYEAALKGKTTAEKDLADHQKTHSLPIRKLAGSKADLQAKLAAAEATAKTAKDAVDVATAKHDAAKAAQAAFEARWSKRIDALHDLIIANAKNPEKTPPSTSSHDTQLQNVKGKLAAIAGIDATIKAKEPGLDPASADPDALVDSDVRKYEQSAAANTAAWAGTVDRITGGMRVAGGGLAPDMGPPQPVTSGLECPGVTGALNDLSTANDAIKAKLNAYEAIDGQKPDAGTERDKQRAEIQKAVNARAVSLTQVGAAVQQCAKEVKADLSRRLAAKEELRKLDPSGDFEREALRPVSTTPVKTPDEEVKELEDQLDALKKAEQEARQEVLPLDAALSAANAAVVELRLAISLLDAEAAETQAKPAYDNEAGNAKGLLPDAQQELKRANDFVNLIADIEGPLAKFNHDLDAWKKQRDAYKTAMGQSPGPAKRQELAATKAELMRQKPLLLAEKARLKALLAAKGLASLKDICSKKEGYLNNLVFQKSKLDPYSCYPGVQPLLDQIATATPKLGGTDAAFGAPAERAARPRTQTSGAMRVGFAAFSPARETMTTRFAGSGPRTSRSLRRERVLAALGCTPLDLDADEGIANLEDPVEFDDSSTDEPTDSVPDDLVKNTGEVKVARYFVFTLTSASGGLWVGDEEVLKTRANCTFEGGGVGCKATDYVKYKKLLGPFPTQDEAQMALCKSITATRYFPLGIGLKGQWQGGTTWYGLWDASVSGCPPKQ